MTVRDVWRRKQYGAALQSALGSCPPLSEGEEAAVRHCAPCPVVFSLPCIACPALLASWDDEVAARSQVAGADGVVKVMGKCKEADVAPALRQAPHAAHALSSSQPTVHVMSAGAIAASFVSTM
jgi:hypothetical protein